MTDEILFEQTNDWGVITLNRPKALNSLTMEMVTAFRKKLGEWEANQSIKAVMIKGEGDRAFCAGGDIRWLHNTAKESPSAACEFFREEYTNNSVLFHFPKPFVALIDGIVMGGGVGVSIVGDFRVCGDNTLFAMPETGIGLFPDVGGGYFLSRLKDGLGLYFALTGARAKAADCLAAEIATHYVSSEKQDDLEAALIEIDFGSDPHNDVKSVLDGHAENPGSAPIETQRGEISALYYGHDSVGEIFEVHANAGTDFANSTLEVLQRMSPTSMALTFEQLKRGAKLDFTENMKMEFRMVSRVMEGVDFFEGVRAQIVDKDRDPKWNPDSLHDVDMNIIGKYFDELGDAELKLS